MEVLSKREQRLLRALHRRKYRERHGLYLVEGFRLVQAALEAGAPVALLVLTPGAYRRPDVQAWLRQISIPVRRAEEEVFRQISDVQHAQGILAVVRMTLDAEEVLAGCTRVLLLDGLQDPGNVGTLIRSAAWFGIEGILAGPGTVDFFNPKVVRATMGGLWDVHLGRTEAPGAWLQRVRTHGRACYAADLRGVDVADWHPAPEGVLVLGSEAHGIREELARLVDIRVTIPGNPARRGVESLNVAVAGSILMHYWVRERERASCIL